MPFLGKTPSQFVDPEVDIDGGSIDGTAIGATSASTATVTTFTSTGIDDNATSTAITIDASQNVSLSNDFTVDTDTLVVDSTNNGVGIGTNDVSDAGLVIEAKGEANTSASVAFKSNLDTYLRVARFGTGSDSTITLGNNYNRNGGGFSADNSAYPVHNITFHTDGSMRFGTDAAGSSTPTERMRILPAGGITFNGDTATANALDDYEEGTWTPAMMGATTAGTFTFSQRYGNYTKVGNIVHARMFMTGGALSGASGRVLFTGLPYQVAGPTSGTLSGCASPILHSVTFGGYVSVHARRLTTYFELWDSRSNLSYNDLAVADFGSGFQIYADFVYEVA